MAVQWIKCYKISTNVSEDNFISFLFMHTNVVYTKRTEMKDVAINSYKQILRITNTAFDLYVIHWSQEQIVTNYKNKYVNKINKVLNL